jgi:RNA polymerase sigma-70 factor, ECF subfamily
MSTDKHNSEPPTPAASTSSGLLECAKRRDPDAWHQLARLYGPLIVQWCRQSSLNDEDAADVVQEVFISVATHLTDYRHERPGDTFRGWLHTITANKILDLLRGRHGKAQAEGGSFALQELTRLPAAEAAAVSTEEDIGIKNILVRRALDLVRPEFEEVTWKAFWGMAIDGRSASEIGAELGMATHAVRQAKYRVFRRLRQELDGELDS